VGHLGLLDDDGRPRVLPVTYAVLDGELWSAVDDKPKRRPGDELARVRWLRARPEAALTVDRYDDDWRRLAWVQTLGRVSVLDVAGHERVLDALAARYPAYRAQPPAGPLLRLAPERALYWRAEGAKSWTTMPVPGTTR
jgi:PPOX class probable F420-dependent enzyme